MSETIAGEGVVVIFSGGLDSSTLLWHLSSERMRVMEVVTFNYGQRHSREIEHAQRVLEAYRRECGMDVPQRLVDISSTVGRLIAVGALTGDAAMPREVYSDGSQKITNVPNRNMIMLSIAVGRASAIGARYVSFAAHASEFAVYPDCRPEFIAALDKAVYLGNLWTPVNLLAPFQHVNKSEIVKVGLKLGVPYRDTWSCYTGGNEPCLECPTCLERTQAFVDSGVQDPALTPSQWQRATTALTFHKRTKPAHASVEVAP